MNKNLPTLGSLKNSLSNDDKYDISQYIFFFTLFIFMLPLFSETGLAVYAGMMLAGIIGLILKYVPRRLFVKNKSFSQIVDIALLEMFDLHRMFIVESVVTLDAKEPSEMSFMVKDIYGNVEQVMFKDIINTIVVENIQSPTNPNASYTDVVIEKTFYIEKELYDSNRHSIAWLVENKTSILAYSKPNPKIDDKKVVKRIYGLHPFESDEDLVFHVHGGRMQSMPISDFEGKKGFFTVDAEGYMSARKEKSTDNIIQIEFDKRGIKYKVVPSSWQWWIYSD